MSDIDRDRPEATELSEVMGIAAYVSLHSESSTVDAALKLYEAFCAERGIDPRASTLEDAEEFSRVGMASSSLKATSRHTYYLRVREYCRLAMATRLATGMAAAFATISDRVASVERDLAASGADADDHVGSLRTGLEELRLLVRQLGQLMPRGCEGVFDEL